MSPGLWRRREPQAEPAAVAADAGWRTVRGQAAASRAIAVGLWLALAAGAVAGIGSWLRPAPRPAPVAAGASGARVSQDSSGAAGFAQLYLCAYLAAGQGTETGVQPYFPSMPSLSNPANSRQAVATTALAVQQLAPGYAAVTVAAHEQTAAAAGGWTDAGWHYFTIGVQVTGAGPGTGYVATGLPAEVAAPVQIHGSNLVYGTPIAPGDGDLMADTVGHFLSAYLAGTGELTRYLSPGTAVTAVSPPAYASVQLTAVATDAPAGTFFTTAPRDGTRRRALATADGTDAAGNQHPLTYAMTLTARGGRWEVTSLDPAPALAGMPATAGRTTAPTTTAPSATAAAPTATPS